MRLLDYETSFGALAASLGFSWSLSDSSWSLFGGSWMGLGSSSGALGNVLGSGEPLFSKHERFASVGTRCWKPVLANEREARAVRNHEDIRR